MGPLYHLHGSANRISGFALQADRDEQVIWPKRHTVSLETNGDGTFDLSLQEWIPGDSGITNPGFQQVPIFMSILKFAVCTTHEFWRQFNPELQPRTISDASQPKGSDSNLSS